MPVAVPRSDRHTIGRVRDLRVREVDLVGVLARPVVAAQKGSDGGQDNPHVERRVRELAARAAALGVASFARGRNRSHAVSGDAPSLFAVAESEGEAAGPFRGLTEDRAAAPVQSVLDETIAAPGAVGVRTGAVSEGDLLPEGERLPLSLLPAFLFDE